MTNQHVIMILALTALSCSSMDCTPVSLLCVTFLSFRFASVLSGGYVCELGDTVVVVLYI